MAVTEQDARAPHLPARNLWRAMWSGFRKTCPKCGKGAIFGRYLKVKDHCGACEEALHHQRADDAPPYFTITIVAHIVVPGLLMTERLYTPPIWLQLVVWLPLTLLLCVLLLPRVKGALIGLQWANYMHGFNPHTEDPDGDPRWDTGPDRAGHE